MLVDLVVAQDEALQHRSRDQPQGFEGIVGRLRCGQGVEAAQVGVHGIAQGHRGSRDEQRISAEGLLGVGDVRAQIALSHFRYLFGPQEVSQALTIERSILGGEKPEKRPHAGHDDGAAGMGYRRRAENVDRKFAGQEALLFSG